MTHYSVKKIAKLSGVSVRTLHHYDEIGLLKPSIRTEARYRLYGETELLRLQQILFYKELDFPLKEICEILDNPEFSLVDALKSHKLALHSKRNRIKMLLTTIDKTINNLKNESIMLKPEELYEGISKEKAEAYRKGAVEKYGKESVEKSEAELNKLGKEGYKRLKSEADNNWSELFQLRNEDPTSAKVQEEVARHYEIIRKYWGTSGSKNKQAEAYSGLGQLYIDDDRYTSMDGKPHPEFALFLSKAMRIFAEKNLQ